MADQVSRMASGGLSASHEVVDELFGVVSRAASGFQEERNKFDVWISVKFDLALGLPRDAVRLNQHQVLSV